jgi:ComF family protein
MFDAVFDPILATVFPQTCHVCRGPVAAHADGVACSDCWEATRIFDGTDKLCNKCGAVLKNVMAANCGQCDDGIYDAAFACGVYEKAIAATVVSLKKNPHLPRHAHQVLHHLVDRVSPDGDSVIVPVPLSRKRKHERGHNQADVIGEVISKYARLPMHSNALQRVESSPIHRVGMDKKAREATVKNSFDVAAPRLIDGRNVLLVDDVFTSGSTASACARVLKKSGAASVEVITLARAVLYR